MTDRHKGDEDDRRRPSGASVADMPTGGYQRPAAEGRRAHDPGDRPGAGQDGERGLADGVADEIAEAFDEEDILERIDQGQAGRGDPGEDARVRSAIQAQLAAESWLVADSIEVRVHQGEVRLTGMVETRSERSRAAELAGAVEGVSYVQNDIRARNPYYHGVDREAAAVVAPAAAGAGAAPTSGRTTPKPPTDG